MMPLKKTAVWAGLAGALAALGAAQATLGASDRQMVQAPRFEVDPVWPKPLPNHWILGSVIGVGIDSRDHVYIIHRGDSTLNQRTEAGMNAKPPIGECCQAAPPIVEFDPEGNLVKAWGGPGEGYEWPASNHGITIDDKDNVWIGGNGAADSHILKFTHDGKFLQQIGTPGQQPNSNDSTHFGRVAKISFDLKAQEAYVADGYGNKRVAVLDMDTGAIKRYWGAYGEQPDDTRLAAVRSQRPLIQQFRNPVHCAEPSNDGLVYVCDRPNDRIQVFQKDGKFVKEVRIAPEDPRRRLGVGHRLLEGRGPEVHLPGRRQERAGLRDGPAVARDPHQLRRRRPPARAVLRRAQHRHRLEGQHLHDRDLRGQAPAEVRVQGRRGR